MVTGIQVLRSAMKAKGWDELELARESGVHITLVRRYFGKYCEKKKPIKIGPRNALRFAKALDVEVAALLYGSKAS